MPFDPAPREVKVGRFQNLADAMLRGCAVSQPTDCPLSRQGGVLRACALGAICIGLGALDDSDLWPILYGEEVQAMEDAYAATYNSYIRDDNDTGRFTREQIAARIAAL